MQEPDNIDDLINAWHNGAGGNQELWQYLGWTWKQYKTWVETGKISPVEISKEQ